jgi:hypothetical protein
LPEQASKKTAVVVMVLFATGRVVAGELLQETPFLIGEATWQLNRHCDFLIPSGNRISELGNALVGHGEHGPRLGAGWKLKFGGSIDRIDFDRIAQDGLEVAHLHFREDVEAIALQPWVGFDGEKHVEITGGTTPGTSISFTGDP